MSAQTSMPAQMAPLPSFRLRVRYAKRGRLAYLGHLEVIHTIERAVRRAAMPYAVSQGFSPHMRVGFTSALPVGTSSSCEWFDLFLTDLVPAPEALRRLCAASAPDLMPDLAGYIDLRTPALTAEITRVGYRIELVPAPGRSYGTESVRAALESIRARQCIPYQRGKKAKELDLEKTLLGFTVVGEPCSLLILTLDTLCDNEGSLRPEILLAALDQELTRCDDPIVSTGIQNLVSFERYRVERIYQKIVLEDGSLADPLDVSSASVARVVEP